MSTYLLTWNPKRFDWTQMPNYLEQVRKLAPQRDIGHAAGIDELGMAIEFFFCVKEWNLAGLSLAVGYLASCCNPIAGDLMVPMLDMRRSPGIGLTQRP